jgi:predicted MFS family arabinose efflux permease
MAADLTRDQHRAKTMAMIGSTIGLAFAFSLIASPWLNNHIGVPGIFAMTAVLAILAMLVVWRVVPDVTEVRPAARVSGLREFGSVLINPQLARLNYGIFVLHAVLMALFIAVPFSLRDMGLPVGEHWKVYLPVMLASLVLMLPAIMSHRHAERMKLYFVCSVALLLIAHVALPWLTAGVIPLAVFLLLFFTPFNILEALLPSLTAKLAPAGAKGVSIGLYSSIQFLGTFVGAALGGFAYSRSGLSGIVIADVVLLATWLVLAFGMRIPSGLSTRTYSLPGGLSSTQTETLLTRLRLLPGVRKAHVDLGEATAFLEVDSAVFDEENAKQTIMGK